MNSMVNAAHSCAGNGKRTGQSGFTLTEFLISSLILMVVASGAFTLLTDMQRTASYQTEVQSVLSNTSTAMEAVERCIRQAGNDPFESGLAGITIISANEFQIRSDLTGSSGTSNPDKGDPDGDISDSGEDITIRYNSRSRSLEIVPDRGPAQIVAGNIAGLSFRYYDSNGNPTTIGDEVRKIEITISGASSIPNPQTHQIFGIQLSSEVSILT